MNNHAFRIDAADQAYVESARLPARLALRMIKALDLLKPPPLRAAWQWAEEKRSLPPGTAEPGPYRSSRTPWVRQITEAIAHPDVKMVVFVCGSQMSKALALDTPIPTPRGWSTMGELESGDRILDDLGRPTTVLGCSPVMHGHQCYRVDFEQHNATTEIVADAEHLWLTEQSTGPITTEEIFGHTIKMPLAGPSARITAVVPVESVPVRCIKVDSPSSLFLAGPAMIPTHNTDGVLLNSIGWKMDDDPQPVIYFGPTEKNVKSVSKDRLSKLIEGVPTLYDALSKGKANTVYEKYIHGIRLGLGWGTSPTELASHPAALVLIDERDRMGAIKGEGDPVGLALARIATFPNGTIVVVSTPLLGHVESEMNEETRLEHWQVAAGGDVRSPTWALWQQGSRREWAVPCPHCQEYYIPRRKTLKWTQNADPTEALRSGYIECPLCLDKIYESHKDTQNARGAFVAPGQSLTPAGEVDLDVPFSEVETFWASGLVSPWVTYGERAFVEVTAQLSGDSSKVQTSHNTGFGEVYHIIGEAPDWEEVAACVDGYTMGQIPPGVKVLYAGVDVQVNRLVYIVRGWTDQMGSWLIETGEIWGDTDQLDVWNRLDGLLFKQFPDGYGISRMGIDCGYRTNEVYAYCRKHPRVAVPTKGNVNLDPPFKSTQVEINARGRVIKTGIRRWRIDATLGKAWVHSRIRWPEQSEGGWFVPNDVGSEYCQQVVAESQLPDGKWEVHGPNHYLDCEVIAYYMARIHGVRSGLTRVVAHGDGSDVNDVTIPMPRMTIANDPYLG